ncbi:UDP-2-acetamido-2-dideoxy-d-ribo-hex-3-uluronic acid transaminase [Synechococcus sp. BIOS-E4-1]|uniref:DegT/DnrJ/EryC1/StrS family aminotransferase n=1 Tax=Synechococcus sp. BIOS-E4-1 TaxID=1400864 RepID=UPI001646E5FC|nr:DegT/DnrJ/EryC1/StrS family aminotransferase [Synechococcus sp. BIOS-E4-1]QNI52864.1 UDP-2-acetamido-2-dideoxy-d-ribo-hex-3-uluronic acid transaminase [Synechococcus sp. BIOS-E4-1]
MQFIDLTAQQKQLLPDGRSLRNAIDGRIAAVLDHGQYILGPEVVELEKRLAAYVGVNYCIALASGTDALLISLMALGVQLGDEVITTPFSFISTAETIALLGAVPVYVDIDPVTYNLDPSLLERAITARTKAIVPVSLYGQPADFAAINPIAARHGIPVIEDGAQSFGSTQHGRYSCSLSTIGTTSFFPSKPLGGYGDGGACFTSDRVLAERIRRISRHGQSRRYFHTDLGVNGRIDTLQAAIVLAKFEVFETEVEARGRIGASLSSRLQAAGIKSTPQLVPGNTSVYAQFTIEVENRPAVQASLKEQGIPSSVHYPTLLYQQPGLVGLGRCSQQSCGCPLALSASERVLSLPFHPYLTEAEQERIAVAVAVSSSTPQSAVI